MFCCTFKRYSRPYGSSRTCWSFTATVKLTFGSLASFNWFKSRTFYSCLKKVFIWVRTLDLCSQVQFLVQPLLKLWFLSKYVVLLSRFNPFTIMSSCWKHLVQSMGAWPKITISLKIVTLFSWGTAVVKFKLYFSFWISSDYIFSWQFQKMKLDWNSRCWAS